MVNIAGLTHNACVLQAVWVVTNDGECLAVPNFSNGDCLFQALSHQLQGAMSALCLRHTAVQYMRQNLADFVVQLTELGRQMIQSREIIAADNEELPRVVLDALWLPWTWGGAECIAALARHLRREILVFQEGGPAVPFTPPLVDSPRLTIIHRYNRKNPIHRTHYESVIEVRNSSQVR
jgi:hypothetical protein